MPPKQPPKNKPVQNSFFKASQQAKDILPSSIKSAPRDGKSLKVPEAIPNQQIPRTQFFQEFPSIEEWPGDEAAKNFDFGLENGAPFSDKQFITIDLTKCFISESQQGQLMFWRRPPEFIKTHQENTQIIQQKVTQHRRTSMFIQPQSFKSLSIVPTKIHQEDQEIYSPTKRRQNFPDQEASNENVTLRVFEIVDREETMEEFEARKKEQLEKQQKEQQEKKASKKAGKQEVKEVIEDVPQKKKDVKLSNIQMADLPSDSRWIASQLQMIKDKNIRDIYTDKPIWTKIYPQKEGVPVYNPSGRYWVKLYYRGKERKIEVDDKMPVNYQGNCKFPGTVKIGEIWSMLFTKAIIKLLALSSNIQSIEKLTGNGFIIYSLTGLMSETIIVNQKMANEQFIILKTLLSDEHYFGEDLYVACYCDSNYKPDLKSQIQNQKEHQLQKLKGLKDQQDDCSEEDDPQHYQKEESGEQVSPYSRKHRKSPSFAMLNFGNLGTFHKNYKELMPNFENLEHIPSNIITGFAYPIFDSFFNSTFNMVYVQKRSEKEVKLKQEFFELSKITMHKMTKEEKLEHRKRKKELRELIGEEDRKRIELITKPPIQHRLFKIKTNCKYREQPNFYCQFSEQEIEIAKVCLLNKLPRPPNYDMPEIRNDDRSVVSSAIKTVDESFVVKPLEDFSSVQNLQTPKYRVNGGYWLLDYDFLSCFQYIQVYYNPAKFPNNKIVQVPVNPDKELNQTEENEVLIVEKNESLEKDEKVLLLFGFQSASAQKEIIKPAPFCILQKFDFSSFQSVQDYPILKGDNWSQQVYTDNQNSIFRIAVTCPVEYTLQISCQNSFRICSVFEYLKEFEGFESKTLNFEYQAIEAQRYHCFFKIRVTTGETGQFIFFMRIKSSTDNNMLKYFRLKQLEDPSFNDPENRRMMIENVEGIHKNEYEQQYILSNYIRVQLKPSSRYYLQLEGISPYQIQEGAMEIELVSRNPQFNFELLEQVEPLRYSDKYQPTKYGILFREKLFVPDQTVVSFYLKLAEIVQQLSQAGLQAQKAPPAKKGAAVQEAVQDFQEKELEQSRLIRLELIENDQVIVYNTGINSTLISNVLLNSTKDEKTKYYLQATFDLREWPECKVISEETQNLIWSLALFSTETVALVKDTDKEDREKQIKKSWEDQEAGRAERAKKARRKYMLQTKQQNGEQLTAEELEILNEPRLTKKQKEEELKQQQQTKGKAPPKKDDKKGAKGPGKGQEQVLEQKKPVEKPFPQAGQHSMQEIKQFLEHLESDRVITQFADHAGLINVRTDENKQEIKENALLSFEDLTSSIQKNLSTREDIKLVQRDEKSIQANFLSIQRKNFKESWEEFQSNREQIKLKIVTKILKEKELLNICSTLPDQKPPVSVEEFTKLINEYQLMPEYKPSLATLANKIEKNFRIYHLIEKINSSLTNYDIDALQQCLDDINNFSAKGIDPELIEKVEDMIDEAKENPNFLAEKQAELKKAGKKGKK